MNLKNPIYLKIWRKLTKNFQNFDSGTAPTPREPSSEERQQAVQFSIQATSDVRL